MPTVCQKDLCCGCMACIDICPVHAISMDKGIRAYNANIDETVCIKCNKCHKTCQNNKEICFSAPISWHEAWVSNDTIRQANAVSPANKPINPLTFFSITKSSVYEFNFLFRFFSDCNINLP